MSVLFLLVVLNALVVTCDSQQKTIFLLAGQSNMAGRGGVNNHTRDGKNIWDGVVPLECQPNPNILKFDARLNWVEAREPLHTDIDLLDNVQGIGPGMPFAHAVLKLAPTIGTIGLVPCAHSSTSMQDWKQGTEFYNQMIKRAEASIQTGGKLGGLLWWQGGGDARDLKEAESFYNNTVKFFNDVRTDLKLPNLPILQVMVPRTKSRPYMEKIREAQYAIDLPNLKTADSDGLPLEEDGIHVTSQAQITVGDELAILYISLSYH